jgi:GNAT superfamily N-acetyltransferase
MGIGGDTLEHLRRLGPRVVGEEVAARVRADEVNLGLRCELSRRPPVPPARIPLEVQACGPEFRGLDDELAVATGRDYGRVLRRKRLHDAGVRTLHAAFTDGRVPVYVQWLFGAEDQDRLNEHASELWPRLGPDEAMVEFAYTFVAWRGHGVMAHAMGRLLDRAAERGARSVLTYVRSDNVASLRGCAKVGFELDHARTTAVRLGRRQEALRPATGAEREAWARATAPRPPAAPG